MFTDSSQNLYNKIKVLQTELLFYLYAYLIPNTHQVHLSTLLYQDAAR